MSDATPDVLRHAVNEIANQLCLAVDGKVDFTVRTKEADPDAEKLVLLINFLLDSVSRLLDREQAHKRELDRRVAERSAKLKGTWDTLIDGLIEINEHGIILDCNPSARSLLGTTEAILGHNINEFMPEPTRSRHDGYLRHYLETGEKHIIGKGREVEAQREDGTLVPVRLAVTEINVDGQRRFVGLLRDISDERAHREALHRERDFTERLLDSVPDIIYAFDTNLRFIRWNEAMLDVVGMDNEEFARSRVPQYIAERDWPRMRRAIREVFTRGHAQTSAHIKTASGRYVPYDFVAARLTDADGKLLGLVGSGRNIEDRELYQMGLIEARETAKKARRAAENASQAKSRFLASMSHELRTPLNAVIGYSELILEELEDGAPPENSSEDLRSIRDAGRHLLSLINNVLDLSRIEAGQMSSHIEELHPAELTRAVSTTAKPLIEGNNNRFKLDIPDDLPVMHSDSGKLRQCLINLLGNAAKFTKDGEVRLSVRQDEDVIIWEVADTGIGMSDEEQERIFDTFVQADDSVNRRFGGSGLGLSLTQQLIRLLGGRIQIASTPNAGSTFTLICPLASPAEDLT